LKKSIKEIYDHRKSIYNKADITIKTKSNDTKLIIKKVLDKL